MKTFIYFGKFPPPYGGVTVKNKLLFDKLSSMVTISQSGYYNQDAGKFSRFSAFIKELLLNKKRGLVIGISQDSLKKVTLFLYALNPKLMGMSVVMVMGGTFPELVKSSPKLQVALTAYKAIYVEAEGMKKQLNLMGVENVFIFPNCRERYIGTQVGHGTEAEGQLKCLFFSLISKDKGVDVVLEAASILKNRQINFSIDFYGPISPDYEAAFLEAVNQQASLNYNGLFKSKGKGDVYEKMQAYDLFLFPTKWKNEGVPGALVEAKFSGLPAIVSDLNYNSEIVEDGVSGVVLKENTPEALARSIERLSQNRKVLEAMKMGARTSSEAYVIENYLEEIKAMMVL
ncbi:MAG: glycosyltransferase [Vallitaleaceae bacterium]|nr:glycosyltransferase [Vallitaleaceae bacterium]